MTEDEAKAWLRKELGVSRETLQKLAHLQQLIAEENTGQNLISRDSQDHIWPRHFVDSAQLLTGDLPVSSSWLDLGTGAGFPGLVIALLRDAPITFVESRRKRVEFLRTAASQLGLSNVIVEHTRLETMATEYFGIISARAFASLRKTFENAHRFSRETTIWLLPKGKSAQTELESVAASWHGVFHVKPSVTETGAGIIVASQVRPMGSR